MEMKGDERRCNGDERMLVLGAGSRNQCWIKNRVNHPTEILEP